MNPILKSTLFYITRYVLYAAMMYLLYLVFMYDARNPTITGKFGEISATEILQEVFLFIMGFLYILAGRRDKQLTTVSNLISVFIFIAFIREFNNFIDFWFFLVLPLLVLFFWLIYRDRRKIVSSLHYFLELPSTAWFVSGFLVTFIFSRFYGRSGLWMAILESNFNRAAKSAAEEGIELLGYTLLLIATLELLIVIRRKKLDRPDVKTS